MSESLFEITNGRRGAVPRRIAGKQEAAQALAAAALWMINGARRDYETCVASWSREIIDGLAVGETGTLEVRGDSFGKGVNPSGYLTGKATAVRIA